MFAVAFCITALTSSAQWSLGIKGGWDYTSIKRSNAGRIDETYSPLSGYDVGIQARYGFTNWFALRTDLSVMRRSHRMDRHLDYLDSVYTEHHNLYLMLPVLADFSFGGLSDGTYTVTEVNPASGATSSKLSFTADINYSSPESIKAVSDPLNLVSPSEGIVYNIVLPSRLPFTGGRWVLALSISAALLFGLGAAFFLIRKRKKA